MRYDSWPNLATMFFDTTGETGDRSLFWRKSQGRWQPTSAKTAASEAAAVATGLTRLGIAPGDRVALISESRPEWAIADFAIMAAGAITVPAYTTNSTAEHLYVLSNSGAKGAIVSTAALADKVLPAARQTPGLEFVITMDQVADGNGGAVTHHAWNEVVRRHAGAEREVSDRARRVRRSDTACIIHTSGTGGVPKGVMLSHGAILSNCKGAYQLLLELGLDDEVFLSFLPLSHSYEHTAGLMFPVSIGAQIYYADGVDRLTTNMAEARPTLMTAVPRLYESMHARMLKSARQAGGLKEKLFHRAVALGLKRYEAKDGLGIGERLTDFVLERLVRKKVKAQLGGRLKALVSGGAPLNPDIGKFFLALGLRVLQGYGQTESAPVVSCNPPKRVRIETVGPPVVDVDVRIADDGEILVRGELVMQGYWNDAKATAEVLRDGWLHTGDIGEIDPDGYIRITDRKKDIIVNSGGDNVAPQRVEGFLTLQSEIGQAMVYGDRRPHLVALIVPDEDFTKEWARGHGVGASLATLTGNTEFQQAIGRAIERVNAGLSVIERVRRFKLIAEPFTIANEMLTPSLKIRRHKIKAAYGKDLEDLYWREAPARPRNVG
jgi:long-chain acyl-CoA synthetase